MSSFFNRNVSVKAVLALECVGAIRPASARIACGKGAAGGRIACGNGAAGGRIACGNGAAGVLVALPGGVREYSRKAAKTAKR